MSSWHCGNMWFLQTVLSLLSRANTLLYLVFTVVILAKVKRGAYEYFFGSATTETSGKDDILIIRVLLCYSSIQVYKIRICLDPSSALYRLGRLGRNQLFLLLSCFCFVQSSDVFWSQVHKQTLELHNKKRNLDSIKWNSMDTKLQMWIVREKSV